MITHNGKKINVFIDDKLNGIQAVWSDNWIGQIFIGTKESVKLLPKISELENKAGLYFLTTGRGITDLYVGESGNVVGRIIKQSADKDWWETFIIFTSFNKSISKAHVKYLEKAFLNLAEKNLSTIRLDNDKNSGGSELHHSEIAFVNNYMEEAIFILKNLHIIDFTATEEVVAKEKVVFDLHINVYKGLTANIKMTDKNKFILSKGSYIKAEPQKSFIENCYNELRIRIINEKKVKPCDIEGVLTTQKDIVFNSASALASVVLGRGANGKIEIKAKDNIPLKELYSLDSNEIELIVSPTNS